MSSANPPTALESFYHWESTQGESPYLRHARNGNWEELTWNEVGDQARRVAAALQSIGAGNGERVCILSNNCPYWIIADLATMMSGAASAPAFTTMTPEDVLYILEHSGARILIVGETGNWHALKPELPDDITVITMPETNIPEATCQWEDILQNFEPLAGNPHRDRNDELTTVYTSGSTGLPKGVMYDFEGASHIAQNLAETFRVTNEDRMISYLPLAHGFERAVVDFMSLHSGYTVSFNENQTTFAADMQAVQPTLFQCVPRLWTKFQEGVTAKFGGQEKLGQLLTDSETAAQTKTQIQAALGLSEGRILLTGSAPTPLPLHDWYEALDMPLCEIYGQSEVLSGTSNLPWDRKPGTLGKPTANTEIRIADNGEILIKAKAVMTGYLNEPEKTAQTLKDGWIYTGDKGQLDEDGFLKITGQVKELFKTAKGKYVAPVPIEGHFVSNPYLEQVCLIGSGLPQTALAVQLSAEGLETAREKVEDALVNQLAQINAGIDKHAQIACVMISAEEWNSDNGFVTHTMKIKRSPLEKHFLPIAELAFEQGATVVEPRFLWES